MHFLPIVDRELRRAMRRKSTVRWRLVSVALMSVIAGLFLGVEQFNPSPQFGRFLFCLLTGYTGLICLLAGPFLTADCISEERRDGTLGLLFLSNLHGYDVVLGKFVSLSLNVFYGILAVQPIMAIPIMLGGVSGDEFWSLSLGMLNLLFFSLSLGILMSAASMNTEKPALRTTFLLVLCCGVFPMLAKIARSFGFAPLATAFNLISPTTPFWLDYAMRPVVNTSQYWNPLLFTHFLGWTFLALASAWLPRNWKDKPFPSKRNRPHSIRVSPGLPNPDLRDRNRARLLSVNPINWLMGDAPGMTRAVWVVTVIALFIPFCISLVAIELLPVAIVCVLLPILFLITLLVAVQSTRFFVDARRSNTLELVLCTPLKIQEIIEGQFLAIQHIFLGPVALVTLLQLAGLSLVFSMGYGPYFTTAAVFPGVFFVLVPGFFVLHLAAVAWAGMWMAATLDKPQNAIRLTVMFIVVMQVLRHVWCLPIFPVDILIIIIARERLHRALRPRASIGPPAMPPVTLPPVLRPPGVPPVLPR